VRAATAEAAATIAETVSRILSTLDTRYEIISFIIIYFVGLKD
jgi:hypothetical protein